MSEKTEREESMARRSHHRKHNHDVSGISADLARGIIPDADQENLTPAQRYAAAKKQREQRKTLAYQFASRFDFPLDDFQQQALRALEAGDNVLVAAPTGAGKTVIADFAVYLAQQRNLKAFYTTPIKALSNQKYHDLVAQYGRQNVGLLTGDISINSEANIVVMTTEVLRNMLYENSVTLTALRYVVFDEIHFLGDQFRGQVWEESIIHLPSSVKIVGLSATVSNIEDFGAWIESVRGHTRLIISENRPVPLQQSVMVQTGRGGAPELFDLYDEDETRTSSDQKAHASVRSPRTPAALRVNPQLLARLRRLDDMSARRDFDKHRRRSGRSRGSDHVHRPWPQRWEVVDELDYRNLLPGIFFIFSRLGCEKAVEECMHAGLSLTSDHEYRLIGQIADEMAYTAMSEQDLRMLGYKSFKHALQNGFACHHAGMIALFREIVEKVFEQGLVKVVFATETLALGINMPARSVVIERLDKFNGVARVPLTPGQYTQLTGRAGRRGIDDEGHAIVVDHEGFEPAGLAAMSSRRVYPLHSQFQATFNMAVNLLAHSDLATAHRTLDRSFAQWEANESAEQMEKELASYEEALSGYEKAFACDYGDFKEFLELRQQLSNLEKGERRRIKHTQFTTPQEKKKALERLDRKIRQVRLKERNHPCANCPDIDKHLQWGMRWLKANKRYALLKDRFLSRTGVVSRRFDLICRVLESLGYLTRPHTSSSATSNSNADNMATSSLATSSSTTNSATVPDFQHDNVGLSASLSRTAGNYELTWRGQLLRRLFSEHDLFLAECMVEDAFHRLDAQSLAAVLSGVIYEARRSDEARVRHFPGGRKGAIARTIDYMDDVWDDLEYTVEQAGLPQLPEVNWGLVEPIYRWSADATLNEALSGTLIQPGDFVRSCKRLLDVLGQVRQAAEQLGDEQLAHTAQRSTEIINRGVVAYSSLDSQDAEAAEVDE